MAKWKYFSIWSSSRDCAPLQVSALMILDCLLSWKQLGLSINSIKVHLAAISAFYPPLQGAVVFLHQMVHDV